MLLVSIAATIACSPFFEPCVKLPDDRRLFSDRVSVAARKARHTGLTALGKVKDPVGNV